MELISREQAIDALKEHRALYCDNTPDAFSKLSHAEKSRVDELDTAIATLVNLPPAEPKRGKWIRDGHHIRCDQCGMYMCDTDREGDRIPTEFCPNCGADMREVTT